MCNNSKIRRLVLLNIFINVARQEKKKLNENVIRHERKQQLADPSTEQYLNFTQQLDYTTTYCLN